MRGAGRSTKGNCSTVPSRIAIMRRMTEASEVRRTSGSVKSGRLSKSSSAYSRTQVPGPRRPQRPDRWRALAFETGSMGRRWMRLRWP